MNKIKLHNFFTMYFPHGAFVVANFSKGEVAWEGILEEYWKRGELTPQDFKDIRTMNNAGYGIFFTPNAVKEDLGIGKTHTLENFESVNAVYTDIDIEETKECVFEEDFKKREDKKAEIAGRLWYAPLQPSLVISSRNGMQAYWLTQCNLETFKKIQKGIYEHFADIGADKSAMKEVQLMRVPSFLHDKEPVIMDIFHEISMKNEDGSLKYWPTEELLKAFPVSKTTMLRPFTKKITSTIFTNLNDIFARVVQMPIMDVFNKINGTVLVGGEILEFDEPRNDKVQIRVNGKPSPNWISLSKNKVFSNNQQSFCNIFHFCGFYGFSKKELAKKFKKLFPANSP